MSELYNYAKKVNFMSSLEHMRYLHTLKKVNFMNLQEFISDYEKNNNNMCLNPAKDIYTRAKTAEALFDIAKELKNFNKILSSAIENDK